MHLWLMESIMLDFLYEENQELLYIEVNAYYYNSYKFTTDS